ncbi:MAG TPA: site-specific integrase [Ktedonobacteraceae bacterium]|nr:site-specific integrase [Ktedonobacteraceae bacterium]
MTQTPNDYDAQVEAIRAYNQPILDEFRTWLEQSGLAEKTVKAHVDNIDFFTEYLVYYEPLEKLDEADGGDIWMFLSDWFPRKAVWSSEASVKSNMASFKKFFQWLGETGRVSPEIVADVLSTLKEGRDHFLEAVDDM